MTINFEIKSQLAKLLATEDLVVENKDVETAEFNVHTRVLTLPFWKRASSTVYDMLVGHEVGHALFTPDEDWTEKIDVPQQIVNVCEDARIEKLIKRKYAGLAKTFFNAYKELNDEDFFELEDQNIDDLNLADRANLYFKGSSHISVDFSVEEKEIVDLIGAAETFDDALHASEVLYKYCVDQQQKEEDGEEANIQQELDTGIEGGDRPDLGKDDTEYSEEKDEGEGQSESKTERVPEGQQSQPQRPTSRGEIEVLTDEILQEKLSELNDPSTRGNESAYASVPKVNLDNIIIPHTQVRDELNEHFNSLLEATEEREWTANYSRVDGEYRSFKNSAKKEVSYLVKEFECKKSADAYARSSTARTGVLDTTKLHTYKFNEDIFKRINVVPDGKNHGLIFILDWSGSMTNCLLSTLKQLYNLIWFCQKVQIPFEVYAFSNTYRYNQNIGYYGGDPVVKLQEEKEYDLVVDNNFVLLNFFSSKFNKAGLENQMANVWRLASNLDATNRSAWHTSYHYVSPNAYRLGGTPLNDTLVCLHQILPQFKKENKLQKVQCVILTDGEGAQMPIYKEYKDYRDDDYHLGTRHLNPESSYLRNRKTGYTYKVPYSYYGFTDVLLKDLKQVFSDVNFIGIRIVANRDFGHFIRKYEYLSDEKYKKARKAKTYSIKDSGYDSYFAIIDSALSNDDEFEVQEDASKAQIKRAFVKSLQAKKLNKKVLGEFVELVA